MYIMKDVDLSKYSTMRLGGKAKYLANINDKTDIPNYLDWAKEKNLPVITIGSGSNIIWGDKGFKGLVLVNKIPGINFTKLSPEETFLAVGAGENWDKVVKESVKKGLHGIEALSLIPGTAGATPIQNVGAYGQEVSDTIESIEAYDIKTERLVNLANDTCQFGYRTSRFKTKDRNRFVITSITFSLNNDLPQPPFYASLQKYIDTLNITKFNPKVIRELVIAIRSSKLPNPKKIANNGSFFANPIVSNTTYYRIRKNYKGNQDIPAWKVKDGYKLSAAWLIEQIGYKDKHDKTTGMATWHLQPLVLVNEKAKKTKDLIKFRDKIQTKVFNEFGVNLQQEPEII
ncbi:UDP-N-acetylmuramate dehydrogenase [Candidatus Saccharibacteria bacterium]|nr:UDP-N-acetylmuramate dehydrogenase [Candidatus Saccharibacteria bacterium]